ncbi:2-C-methyl-D-erythritol 4-phosphate cytidylyltransferase [Ascidiaceihabitans sp.]|uniref:2-C-methyl-D-erythritol 4-phosphate cytidylyltransferase n=1 Tax=Ascidiaceihabitans sp. TaxID=1872644 RepID=UPI00329A094F
MTLAVLIVAAGRGTRAGGPVPKQWQLLEGRSVLAHTVDVFKRHALIHRIVLLLHADDMDRVTGVTKVQGGADRAASVRHGLAALQDSGVTRVLIHDVARPCVSHDTIDAVITALETHAGAAPAIPVTDALWTGENGLVTGTRDRTGLFRAQTPQGFHLDAITKAHAAHAGGAADDVEVARAAGIDVAIVPGDEANLKITYPADFNRAGRILRTGHGH